MQWFSKQGCTTLEVQWVYVNVERMEKSRYLNTRFWEDTSRPTRLHHMSERSIKLVYFHLIEVDRVDEMKPFFIGLTLWQAGRKTIFLSVRSTDVWFARVICFCLLFFLWTLTFRMYALTFPHWRTCRSTCLPASLSLFNKLTEIKHPCFLVFVRDQDPATQKPLFNIV